MTEYRTFGIAVLAAGLLAFCALRGVKGEDLSNVKWGLVAIVTVVAGRTVGRAAAAGGGFKGIASALLTDAKPGDPPAQPGSAP